MIIQKEFLNKIKDFGLNSYEAKLWTALLSRGVATAGELSDIANVPRSRSYDVLESLEKKGFVIMKIGKPIKYLAVPPSEVLDRVKKNIREESEKQEEMINSLKKSDVLNELINIHKEGNEILEPAELTGIIKGRKNIYHHVTSMVKSAEKSVLLITNEAGLIRKSDFLSPFLKKAHEKDIKIKIIAPISKKNSEHAKKFNDFSELKNNNSANIRLCVVDGKSAFIISDEESVNINNEFGVWFNTSVIARSLESVFNQMWDSK